MSIMIYIYSNWVIGDDYGDGSHCNLFTGGCRFSARSRAFSPEDDAWFEREELCAANTCYTDASCGIYFYILHA